MQSLSIHCIHSESTNFTNSNLIRRWDRNLTPNKLPTPIWRAPWIMKMKIVHAAIAEKWNINSNLGHTQTSDTRLSAHKPIGHSCPQQSVTRNCTAYLALFPFYSYLCILKFIILLLMTEYRVRFNHRKSLSAINVSSCSLCSRNCIIYLPFSFFFSSLISSSRAVDPQ